MTTRCFALLASKYQVRRFVVIVRLQASHVWPCRDLDVTLWPCRDVVSFTVINYPWPYYDTLANLLRPYGDLTVTLPRRCRDLAVTLLRDNRDSVVDGHQRRCSATRKRYVDGGGDGWRRRRATGSNRQHLSVCGGGSVMDGRRPAGIPRGRTGRQRAVNVIV